MEEDIKILKQVQSEFMLDKTLNRKTPMLYIRDADRYIQAHIIDKTIENILNRLEQDERVIEEMAKYIHEKGNIGESMCTKTTEDCYADIYGVCEDCIIDHFRKKCE